MKTRILIEVRGGNIQRVVSTNDIEIFYVDHDNMKRGDLQTCLSPQEPDKIGKNEDEMDQIVYETVAEYE